MVNNADSEKVQEPEQEQLVDAVIVLTTIGQDTDGVALARTLVEERVAACVSILPPMASVYRWKGEVEEDREQQLLIKTTRENLEALEARLHQLHPYDVPEFLVFAAEGISGGYAEWLTASLTA